MNINNESIGQFVLGLVGTISIIGMGSILYSLFYEKDNTIIIRKKPASHYPQKPKEDTNTIILDFELVSPNPTDLSEWS